MIKSARGNSRIDTIFVLIIFCVFAISVLLVLMLSAEMYKKMTDISREGYDDRTGLSYIWTKVKNNDNAGKIHIGDFNGVPALCFDEEFSDVIYTTRVYFYDGWIMELFSEADIDFLLEDGAQIIQLDDLVFEEFSSGLIRVSSGGNSLLISPRGSHGTPNPYAALVEGGAPQ
jgi:hypothetical protein